MTLGKDIKRGNVFLELLYFPEASPELFLGLRYLFRLHLCSLLLYLSGFCGIILSNMKTYPDLNEKITQMLPECRYVLIEIEEAGNGDLDLGLSQVRKGGLEKVGDELLNINDVTLATGLRDRIQGHRDAARLDDVEHVGENGGLHHEAGGMRGVRHH